jgi:hypothetical protein
MSSPIVTGLKSAFRYLPQHTLEGALGSGLGQAVEGFMGMSPEPSAPVAPQQVDPADVQRANESFLPKPNLSTMRKPLKGK